MSSPPTSLPFLQTHTAPCSAWGKCHHGPSGHRRSVLLQQEAWWRKSILNRPRSSLPTTTKVRDSPLPLASPPAPVCLSGSAVQARDTPRAEHKLSFLPHGCWSTLSLSFSPHPTGNHERLLGDMGESNQVPRLSSSPSLSSPELTFMSANHVPGTLPDHLRNYSPVNETSQHSYLIHTLNCPQFTDE